MMIEEMDCMYPSALFVMASICFIQKFAKEGDCWVFALTALLLKKISMFV